MIKFVYLFSIAVLLNIPFGYYRQRFAKMTIMWWVMIHAPIPFIILLRKFMGIDLSIGLFATSVFFCIVGQVIGSRFLTKFVTQKIS